MDVEDHGLWPAWIQSRSRFTTWSRSRKEYEWVLNSPLINWKLRWFMIKFWNRNTKYKCLIIGFLIAVLGYLRPRWLIVVIYIPHCLNYNIKSHILITWKEKFWVVTTHSVVGLKLKLGGLCRVFYWSKWHRKFRRLHFR